jgi:hypothetical protein
VISTHFTRSSFLLNQTIKTKIPKIITQKNNNLTYNNTLHVLYIFEFATQTPFNIDEVRRASKITGLI